jgi:hypothetical protein
MLWIILKDFTPTRMKTPMQELICSLALTQDKAKNAKEKEFLDSLIDLAIDLQRDEKNTIIKAFNEGQRHGMFDGILPIDAGAIYYNKNFVNPNNKYK